MVEELEGLGGRPVHEVAVTDDEGCALVIRHAHQVLVDGLTFLGVADRREAKAPLLGGRNQGDVLREVPQSSGPLHPKIKAPVDPLH